RRRGRHHVAEPARAVRAARRRAQRRHRRHARARLAQPRRARARRAGGVAARVVRAALDGRRRARVAGNRPREARPRPAVPRRRALAASGGSMALKIFADKAKGAGAAALDMPTTQVRMGKNTPPGYDPLASVSIMDQLRNASAESPGARKLPVIGNLPVVKQFQVLLALLMLFIDSRSTNQSAAQAATATEMQMLSQRLARGSALASQGQKQAFATVEDSRQKFNADLKALLEGGEVRGTTVDPVGGAAAEELAGIKAKWDVVDKAALHLTQNADALTSLAAGLDRVNDANNSLLELAEQLGLQMGQGGATVREVDFANQLAVLSQRIAKNANALASGEEIDPETAFLLGKDAGTFRDILNGLARGNDALHIPVLRGEDPRATLAEIAKRFVAYDQSIGAILASMQKLTQAKQSARTVTSQSEDLLQRTTAL